MLNKELLLMSSSGGITVTFHSIGTRYSGITVNCPALKYSKLFEDDTTDVIYNVPIGTEFILSGKRSDPQIQSYTGSTINILENATIIVTIDGSSPEAYIEFIGV